MRGPGSDLDRAELAVGDLLANVVRYAPGVAWIHVGWGGEQPLVEVHHLGPGFELSATLPEDPLALGGRGLFIVSHLTEELAAAAKRAGGSKVSAVMPVRRSREHSHDPPRAHRPRGGDRWGLLRDRRRRGADRAPATGFARSARW